MSRLAALDLHIHSALSPCGGEEMAPPAVLLTAERAGLATVGIVDHSSAGNAAAFLAAAEAFAVQVLVGLEIESAEGVHLLALFDQAEPAAAMSELVGAHLPDRPNRPEILGSQWLLNELGDEVGTEGRLLVVASRLTVEQIADATHQHGGVSIAAHINRMGNGLLPTLGFIPPRLSVDLFEVSRHMTVGEARERWPELAGRALIQSSDAHFLGDIGSAVTWVPEELGVPHEPLREWAREVAASVQAGGGSAG